MIELPGQGDPDRCAQALRELVRRHETLRTALAVEDGALVQVVHVDLPVTLPTTDLRAPAARARRAGVPGPRRRRGAGGRSRWTGRRCGGRTWCGCRATSSGWCSSSTTPCSTPAPAPSSRPSCASSTPPPARAARRGCPSCPSSTPTTPPGSASTSPRGARRPARPTGGSGSPGCRRDAGLPTDRPRPAARGHAGAEFHLALPADLVDRAGGAGQAARRHPVHGAAGRAQGAARPLLRAARRRRRHAGGRAGPARVRAADRHVRQHPGAPHRPDRRPAVRGAARPRARRPCWTPWTTPRCRSTSWCEALQPERDPGRTPLYQVGFNLLPMESRAPVPRTAPPSSTSAWTSSGRPRGAGVYLEYSTDLFDADTVARLAGAYGSCSPAAVADPGPGCRSCR